MTAVVTRSEHDLLGDRDVTADAYWGIHTLRATENFPITGTPISAHPHLVDAPAVKEAAALDEELGLLAPEKAAAIVAACREIRSGKPHDPFIVDVIQGGAGTSTNMNANEVAVDQRHLPDGGQDRDRVRGARAAPGDGGAPGLLRPQGGGVP